MLYVCYMFSKHITCFKASVYRGLRSVMLYGYMFLRNPFFLFSTETQHVGCEALGSVGQRYGLQDPWGLSLSPKGMLCVTHRRHRSTPIKDIGTSDKLYLYQMKALIDPIMGFSR